MPSSRRRRRRSWVAPLTIVALGAAATATVVVVLKSYDVAVPISERCTATADGGSWSLSTEQSDNAALIGITPVRRGMPARAATIGIATAMQESRLMNIDYGDRDSVGLFQQRPSQGWGTVEEIMDPVYSTNTFYDALEQVDGYEDMEVTEAAQAVQRSGFPDAYAQHEDMARAWASALTGWSSQSLTCVLEPVATPYPAETVAGRMADRVERDLGGLDVMTADPVTTDDVTTVALTVSATGFGGSGADDAERTGWAVGQWAVAVAKGYDVVAVDVQDQRWTRSGAGWSAAAPDADPLSAGDVRIVLAASTPTP